MKSLRINFEKIQKANPNWSSYICFAEAISGKGYSEQVIRRWFNKLVDKDDYESRDRKALYSHLKELTIKPCVS